MSIKKIFKALKTLKLLGNKYYQFVPEFENYRTKCKDKDPNSYNLLFESQNEDTQNDILDETETGTESDKEEEDYIQNDAARKWQFDYNASTFFANDFPELDVFEEQGENSNENDKCEGPIHVAPGEGKRPTDILKEEDWDLKSFPGLQPDGEHGLFENRKVKLTHQQYFEQRILNADKRFANTAAYVFAAFAFIEKKQLDRNINISFMRGKKQTSNSGNSMYSLDDPYSVLDNSPGTPRYWQKKEI